MSSILASAVGLLTCAVLIFPAVLMGLRPSASRILAPLCAGLVVGIALTQTGMFDRSLLGSAGITIPSGADGNRCNQIMSLLSQNSVLLQPVGPQGLVVRSEVWDQFPQPVKQAVLDCARRQIGGNSAAGVKVIRR